MSILAGDAFKTEYGLEWYASGKKIIEPMTEEEARIRHENRERYTAVLGGERPHCCLEFRSRGVFSVFFDMHLREYLQYQFNEKEPGRLFLVEAIYREYDGDSEKLIKATISNFSTDGKVFTSITDYSDNSVMEANSTVDVTKNYDTWPAFKDYYNLIQKERE